MKSRRSLFSAALLCSLTVALLPGCAVNGTNSASATVEPVASAADPAGRMHGYQLARRYQDVVRVDGREMRQSVEYGFDYDRAVTVMRIYDADGKFQSETLLPGESLHANEVEEARLRELVATHPALADLAKEPGLLVHAGGFVYREPDDPYCGIHSRCLRYIVSKGDGSVPHIHAVVDLVRDRVVYTQYDHRTVVASNGKEFR